ncbi:PKD domain-containing protein [Aestuariivivens insulae]|uniref:PKD domain-containing protein n=1 Tax=Aestuariivivens insulae TaxID=1621988 RepID=UPI001F57A255|nr:PKD domain-containing protein [Aestuariivivens insulae]
MKRQIFLGLSFLLLILLAVFVTMLWKQQQSQELYITETEDYPVWIEMMEEPGVNMEEVKEAFDSYLSHQKLREGDGWEEEGMEEENIEKFEHWYAINSKRLDGLGNVIPAAQVKRELQRFRTSAMFQQQGQWFNYGPINVGPRNGVKKDGGRVKDIEFHPTDANTYCVSTFKGGLFKTTDAGNSWIPLTDPLVEDVYISKVDPTNANTIYIGTNLGVLKSTDGGLSWGATGLTSSNTNALLIKPDQATVIVVGNDNGIYRSTDGGTTFALVKSASKVEELRLHPSNPDIMYAGTEGVTSQFFRSTDGGLTWTENTSDFGQGAFMKIAVTPAAPNTVYVINSRDHLGDDSFEGVYRSTDSGASFTKQSGGTPCITGYKDDGSISRGQPNYNLFIVADPTNADMVYAGGVKSWKSADGGVTWTQVFNNVTVDGGGLHLDQLTWAYSPHTHVLFAVNDGGIYYLNGNGKFQQITDGLPVAEVWECAQSQVNPEVVAGGTFHCGIKLNRDGVWYSPWGGDEATVIFDYSDDTYAYHFKYEKISRSTNGGMSFQRINPSTADRGEYTGTGVLDKSDVNTLFVGLFEVERINNARTATSSTVWDKISSFGGSTKIKKIEQCDADHNIMYASRGSGNFYRSDDVRGASPTWTNLTGSLPSTGTVTDIATHPTDANIVYILQGSKIYKSVDKGSNWTDISTGLPGVALLEMVYDKSSNEGIYVGTDIGVYYKDAALGSWIDYSNGLPAIRVSGMGIYYGATRADSFLTVSTDGRGFWRTALNDVTMPAPTVGFSSDKTDIFTEDKVQFTNETIGGDLGSFMWTFEGGTPSTSIDKDPLVTYNTPGTYAVTLTYITDSGTETKSVANYINVTALPAPVADFIASTQTVFQGNAVNFTDTSQNNPTSWNWTFEGGIPGTSTSQNPSVVYNTLGTYRVSLQVTNSTGSDTKEVIDYITVVENTGSGPLQGHYNFQGNLMDDSSYKRDLAVVGGYTPVYVNDKDGNTESAYQVPGTSGQYLTNTYKGIGGNGERTVTAWIKTTNVGTRKTIVSWGENTGGSMFNVMVANGNIRVEGGACNVQNDDATVERLDTDTWRHIAVTYNPADGDKMSDIKLYIDGVYYANQPDSGDSYNSEATVINTSNTVNNLQIGNSAYNSNYYWRGELDDVRIYSKALTAEEIVNVMNDTPEMAPVANFSSDQTNILVGGEITFSDMSSGAPKTWEWTFDGGTPNTSTEQNPTVTYDYPGTYAVSLAVTNDLGTDIKTIDAYVTVTMPPAPTANFTSDKTEVWEGEQVAFTDTSTDAPTLWDWTFDGGTPTTSTEQNPLVTYSTEGVYTVSLTASNLQGSNTKDVVGYITVKKPVIPNLTINNYSVAVVAETCRNSNNGKIQITPTADYPYTAVITGSAFSQTVNFGVSSTLNVTNLSAGAYIVCITIEGAPYYEQCFTVSVSEPENLSVYSKVDDSKTSVDLSLSGASSYNISINGKSFETTKQQVTVNLEPNTINLLEVSTNKTCQGVYKETIVLNQTDKFYPNPAHDIVTLLLRESTRNSKTVNVSIYSSLGKQVYQKTLDTYQSKVPLNITSFPKGLYIITVEAGGIITNHKMIKQ